jgi:hypothetical protein
MIDYE